MPADTLAIVNPQSGAGSTRRRWPAIEGKLREALGALEVEHTRGPRDAERIAREAVRAGVSRLVVAGGDGTISEVVTGVLEAGLGKEALLGLLPLGSGGDLARALGVPKRIDAAIEVLRAGGLRRVDAGRVRHLDREGRPRTTYFLNEVSFGVSGLVVELVNAAPKRFGGSLAFLMGTLRAFARYRSQPVRLLLDGQCIHEGPLMLGVAAKGPYFGGGMKVAPHAALDGGALEVVVISEMSRPALLWNLPSIYTGAHEQNPHVSMQRGLLLEAVAEPGSVKIDVDGEALGSLPATIEVLPDAIGLFGVRASSEEH